VRPIPSLRLLASEPDLASLPRTTLPDAASPSPPRPAVQEQVRREAAPRSDESAPAEALTFDHVRERIAALPAIPETVPPPPGASASPSPRASGIVSFADRIEAVLSGLNLPGWWRGAAAGLIALVAVGLVWSLGRRRRARPSIDEDAPIQWGPPDESEAALRATLLARRAEAAKGRSAPRLSRGYATLGEALVAMKTAAAKPSPHPATRKQPRVDA